jgi:peptidoglycan/LPS O-acetylase OafA/YrhL
MWARSFKSGAGPSKSGTEEIVMDNRQRSRRVHRWVATLFTLTVAVNFVAMLWGPPPAVITYAPLPPLLFLMITGLVMLVAPRQRFRRESS